MRKKQRISSALVERLLTCAALALTLSIACSRSLADDSGPNIPIRTANNFLSTPVYSQPRAFLQRPAAEALLRVSKSLKESGYGLLIHDAYRPWYVTKIFWHATPEDKRILSPTLPKVRATIAAALWI
jgi:D-alanyl-D-alanine dipeptidase